MDIIVSNAVHDFLSSAPFYLRFPSLINDRIWDTALACTERELDAKRSYGLLALYSYLELALIRATKRLQDPPVRGIGLAETTYHQFPRISNHYARSYFPTMF
jgi:hypothetical protein